MSVEYWIKIDGKWVEVDWEQFTSFPGEKERRPSTWRYVLCQSILGGVK